MKKSGPGRGTSALFEKQYKRARFGNEKKRATAKKGRKKKVA